MFSGISVFYIRPHYVDVNLRQVFCFKFQFMIFYGLGLHYSVACNVSHLNKRIFTEQPCSSNMPPMTKINVSNGKT